MAESQRGKKRLKAKAKKSTSRVHKATSQNLAKGGRGKAKIAKKRTSIRGGY